MLMSLGLGEETRTARSAIRKASIKAGFSGLGGVSMITNAASVPIFKPMLGARAVALR